MRDNYGELARSQYNYYDPEWHPYYKETRLHTIQSVSKSVTSALIGIAIERGEIPDVDTKIMGYFEEYKLLFQDPLKKSITLRDLLTMTAGIKWDEFSYKYTDPLNNAATMESSSDWIKYILALPMELEPGEKFVYNSGITVLLSHILYKATDMHIDEYAEKYLFGPLGIDSFYWKKTPTGLVDAEGGLYLSTRDFAKFGHLYLNNGKWSEKQVLSPEWVKSTMSPDTLIDGSKRRYGYQWWLVPYTGGSNKWIYSGSGYGGQYLLVFPEYDLIVVFNGWNIFDIPRPTIEYLSLRILESVQ
jgi:CubicO group peptidase (beta-lactamase class C family)